MNQSYIENFRLSIVQLAELPLLSDDEKTKVSELATAAQLVIMQSNTKSRLTTKNSIQRLATERDVLHSAITHRLNNKLN